MLSIHKDCSWGNAVACAWYGSECRCKPPCMWWLLAMAALTLCGMLCRLRSNALIVALPRIQAEMQALTWCPLQYPSTSATVSLRIAQPTERPLMHEDWRVETITGFARLLRPWAGSKRQLLDVHEAQRPVSLFKASCGWPA